MWAVLTLGKGKGTPEPELPAVVHCGVQLEVQGPVVTAGGHPPWGWAPGAQVGWGPRGGESRKAAEPRGRRSTGAWITADAAAAAVEAHVHQGVAYAVEGDPDEPGATIIGSDLVSAIRKRAQHPSGDGHT